MLKTWKSKTIGNQITWEIHSFMQVSRIFGRLSSHEQRLPEARSERNETLNREHGFSSEKNEPPTLAVVGDIQ